MHGEPCESESFCIEVDHQGEREFSLDPDCLLWPGFIDFHTHLAFNDEPGPGVRTSDLMRFGVFGAADAGTFGWDNLPASRAVAGFPYKRWVSLLPEGLATYPISPRHEGITPEAEERIHQVMQTPRGDILGIKIRLGQHDRRDDEALLADGVRIADSLGLQLMVHFTDTFLPLAAIVAALRPRDVLTHVFHGRRGSILVNDRLDPAIANAVHRGIVLDVGHGSNHFSWPVFQKAQAQGLLADMISTDVTRRTLNRAPLFHLPFVCSKLVNANLDWDQIYRSTVANPLAYLGFTIPRNSAVVLQPRYASVAFGDSHGNVVKGSRWWDPVLVIYGGRLIWNAI